MFRRVPLLASIGLILVTLAGCSDEPEGSIGRLALIGPDGNVATINADGTNLSPLTSDAEFGVVYSQLTWSAQGSLAFARSSVGGGDGISAQASSTATVVDPTNAQRISGQEVETRGPSAQSISATIEVISPEGERSSHFVSFPPFYMYWSPNGERLAYLGASPPRLQLSILDPGTGDTMPVFNSQPLYFDWSPDGDRLITHHEGTAMELLLSGEPTSFVDETGVFFAPAWTADGIYLVGLDGDRSQLETRDIAGNIKNTVELDSQNTSFAVGEGGNIAILERTTGLAGTLTVVGETDIELSSEALWFFWNDQRNSLVWMEQEGDSINLYTWSRDGSAAVSIGSGRLSRYWLQTYLQFFDQYALSHSWWSPDGSSFLFFGTIDGSSGIWLLDAGGESDPTYLTEGAEAVFDPR